MPRGRATQLLDAINQAPNDVRVRLDEISQIDIDQANAIKSALHEASGDIGAVARRVLEEWDRLTVAERTAGLLLLAELLVSMADG